MVPMTIAVILELRTDADRREALRVLMAELADGTRGFDGCRVLEMHVGESPDELVFYEQWESAERYQAYQAWRAGRGDTGRIGSLLAVPPRVRVLQHLPAQRGS
jgi:quinol monooxygenase YgiN